MHFIQKVFVQSHGFIENADTKITHTQSVLSHSSSTVKDDCNTAHPRQWTEAAQGVLGSHCLAIEEGEGQILVGG